MSRKERYICEVNKSFDIFDNLYKEYPSMQEICRTLNKQDYRIAELKEQLKKSLESNNDLLKQIMELQSQLISERLKGEKNESVCKRIAKRLHRLSL